MYLDGHDVVAHDRLSVEHEDVRYAFDGRLARGEGIVGNYCWHAQRAYLATVKIIHRAVIDEIGRDQGKIRKASTPVKVRAVVYGDVPSGLAWGWDGRSERVGVFSRRGF